MKRYEMDFRRSHLAAASAGKRRAAVPVLPPRIPTPMPVNNNNMSKGGKSTAGEHHHHGDITAAANTTASNNATIVAAGSARLVAKTPYKLLDNEVKTAWINPRIMSKVDLSLIRSNDYKCPSERNNMNTHTHYNHNLSHQKQHAAHHLHHQQHHPHHHHHQQSHAKNAAAEWEPAHVVATTTATTTTIGSSSTGTGHTPSSATLGRPHHKHRSSSAGCQQQQQQQAHNSNAAGSSASSAHAQTRSARSTRHSSTPPAAAATAAVAVAAPEAIVNKRTMAGLEGARGVKLTQIPCPQRESRRSTRELPKQSAKVYESANPRSVNKIAYNHHPPMQPLPMQQQMQQLQLQQLQVPQYHHHHHQSSAQCYLSEENSSVFGVYQETKYTFAVNGMPGSIAQASAAAAFFARAAQKLNLSSSPHRRKRTTSEDGGGGGGEMSAVGFCGALQRSPPPVPPALLRRIGVKEITGVGKVKVMLRVSTPTGHQDVASMGANSFFNLDKRKKQVTLIDPSTCSGTSAPEDRRVGVAAPKMFAFDAMFSQDDSQTEVCSSALTDVIHAVINGTDGCLFCFGHAGLGKSYTMLGTPENANTLGIIPCAISWLFRGINEQKQKTGARFSVRVSAVEVCGPTNQLRDLLAGHSNDSEQSPGVYLRDDPLFGNQPPHCELRVPTAEKAAHYLDAAVECRSPRRDDAPRDSHLLFTLHVYQYSVAGKGGVAGGRSRLHLIDLGNSERGKASGGIPLSGLGNILLAIFNGQKHLPYKEHKLTHLLKDCLSSLTCHAAMIAHVSPYAQNYNDTLTTVQLASRIHRMRRRRIKFVNAGTGNGSGGSSGEEATRTTGTGTSSEPDPSSSDLSADTVIYVGPADDATDGEHPPVYIPSLNSGDNRCAMSKALRGSSAEQRPKSKEDKTPTHRPVIKTVSQNGASSAKTSPAHTNTPKASPARQVLKKQPIEAGKHQTNGASDEQWIDGPRISKSKVAEARHFMKEQQHVKKRETWIDGPMQAEPAQPAQGYGYMDSHKKNMIRKWVEHQTSQIVQKGSTTKLEKIDKANPSRTKELTQFKTFDDRDSEVVKPLENSRKHEIVEEGVIRTGLKLSKASAGIIHECKTPEEMKDDEEDEEEPEIPPALPLIKPLSSREVSLESLDQLLKERQIYNAEYNNLQQQNYEDPNDCQIDSDEEELDEDEVLEIIEVEEPLEPVPMQDCCLQVTEEDIAFCMGFSENPLPEVDQENPLDHPLRILSQENLTVVSTFTDSMSVYTDLERILPRHKYDHKYGFYNDDYEDPDNPKYDEQSQKKFEQLARLHELYSNRLAKANVANSETFQKQQRHKMLSRCESLTLTDMLYGVTGHNGLNDNSSIYSEPAYIPDEEKFCHNCQVSIARPATSQHWYMDPHMSASTTELSKNDGTRPISGRFQRYCHKTNHKETNLAYLRHPDGASNPNLQEGLERTSVKSQPITKEPNFTLPLPSTTELRILNMETGLTGIKIKTEGYDSGHDSTPRTSKHSPAAISRKAESGYDSVMRDSESSSIDSDHSRASHRNRKCKHKHEKSFCSWFLNPFTCKYIEEPPETHF